MISSTSTFFATHSVGRPPPPPGTEVTDTPDPDDTGSITTAETEDSDTSPRFFDQFTDIDEEGSIVPTELGESGESLPNGRGDRPEGPGTPFGDHGRGNEADGDAPTGVDSASLLQSLLESTQEVSDDTIVQTGYGDILEMLQTVA